jgi:hypothetical protein
MWQQMAAKVYALGGPTLCLSAVRLWLTRARAVLLEDHR